MHASLLLWNDTFAHAYPNYERLWRIEPDVMFTGNMSSLLARSAHVQSDLLLPHYVREAWDEKNAGWVHLKFRGRSNAAARNFTYYHWATHADVLGDYHSEVMVAWGPPPKCLMAPHQENRARARLVSREHSV
eukprot:scaffold7916_cov31-Tisochrysis_lutea.AAC.3